MNRAAIAVACLSGALTVGCGPKQFGSICSDDPAPDVCGMACDPLPGADNVCPAGFHCSAGGTCDAQCTAGGSECGDGYVCTEDGRCVADEDPPVMTPDANCPSVVFEPMPVTPSITLVLDQSGSMFDNNIAPGVNRFDAMEDALVGTNGVVTLLESKAYFGSKLYTCSSGNNVLATETVPRALNNAAAIRASLAPKTNGNNTPTHAAIREAIADFQQTPPPTDSPPVIVLATDGLPNSCNSGAGSGGGTTASVNAARDAYTAGIPVYVLAINQTSSHFQDLANAGQGWQPGQPNVPYYPVQNAQELKQAFDTIIAGVISCDLALTASIDENQAMNGTVTINGTPLTYGTDWTLVGGNTIRVQGDACTNLKSTPDPMVSATFPCGSVIF